ncbi:MAG: DNA gyrase subunit A, partial [Acetobacteraceae bacterium]|nr:DNA gyrase subunit A [Acetobacteraceae bacterium]
IAMKLEQGDRLIGVVTCREGDDLLLATRLGRCIRFQISDESLRGFAGRESSGVRGIRLTRGDEVMSLSVLRHVEASTEERAAYLKLSAAKRRSNGEEDSDGPAELEEATAEIALPPERASELAAAEEFLLSVTDAGYGKRSSAYEYRVTGRGGQGLTNIVLGGRNGRAVVTTFPVRSGDHVMLITDAGRLIRTPADQVRLTGRQAMGVMLFRVQPGEHVTSVFPVMEDVAEETVLENGGNDPNLDSEAPERGGDG